jgi:CheY-like chemotaxis protein
VVVDIASDGREAVDLARCRDYDFILMDGSMPTLDGLEATAELRRWEAGGRRTPIVALTAHALPEDRARFLAAGMDDYLTKPVRIQDLRAVIERWTTPASAAAGGRDRAAPES